MRMTRFLIDLQTCLLPVDPFLETTIAAETRAAIDRTTEIIGSHIAVNKTIITAMAMKIPSTSLNPIS